MRISIQSLSFAIIPLLVMKTARFAAVVKAAGKPETYVLLVSPEKDKAFQAAIKAQRVMTVHQELVGNKADHGIVGFAPGRARQFLVFPKSLSQFTGMHIVGIKYDLLKAPPDTAKSKTANPPQKRVRKRKLRENAEGRKLPREKVIQFTKPKWHEEPPEEKEAIQDMKNQVRHAMEVLEQGKQVAAFNLLKRIVDR